MSEQDATDECENCQGRGWIVLFRLRRRCDACRGRGTRRPEDREDVLEFDDELDDTGEWDPDP